MGDQRVVLKPLVRQSSHDTGSRGVAEDAVFFKIALWPHMAMRALLVVASGTTGATYITVVPEF